MKKIELKRRRSRTTPGSLTVLSRKPMRILIAAIPPVRPLDVVGPVEVFGDANRMRGGDPVYSMEIVASGEEKLMDTHFQMPMLADRTYREVAGSFDTVLVAGGDGANKMRYQPPFVDWLKRQCAGARRFGSICTGALVLAKAGLLEGRRATTHWNWCDELAQNYPGVTVDPDPIYVKDGNCYTSAGVTAGIDMSLALVEEDLGSELALRIARMMVVFLRRPGGQSQFSATLAAQSISQSQDHRSLGDLLAWIADNIRRDLSIDILARRAAMSPRNFARLFTKEIGKTPGMHVEDLRLEAARRQLESTAAGLEQVAKFSGFKSAEVLRRAFARRLGTTPSQYRKSFGRAPGMLQ